MFISTAQRAPQLDGLRCVAVMSVFFSHTVGVQQNWSYEWAAGLGVHLFFVLSGFLIAGILLEHQPIKFWSSMRVFSMRRVLRIIPIYYLLLTVMFAVGYAPLSMAASFYLFFFNFSLASGIDAGAMDPFWTLCVEEQFYLFCPLLIWKTPRKILPFVIAALLVGSWIATYISNQSKIFPNPNSLPWCASQFLLAGCLAAYVNTKLQSSKQNDVDEKKAGSNSTLLFFVGLLLLALWYFLEFSGIHHWFALQALALALIVFGLANTSSSWLKAIFSFPPFVFIGVISYGLYLYHEVMMVVTVNMVKAMPLLGSVNGILLLFILSVTISSVSYFAFERTFLKFKKYFAYGGSNQQDA